MKRNLFGRISRQCEKRNLDKMIQEVTVDSAAEAIVFGDVSLAEAMEDPIARTRFACEVVWGWICRKKNRVQGYRELIRKLELDPEFADRVDDMVLEYEMYRPQTEDDANAQIWSLNDQDPLHMKSDAAVTLYLADARKENCGEDIHAFQTLIQKLGEIPYREHSFSIRPTGVSIYARSY